MRRTFAMLAALAIVALTSVSAMAQGCQNCDATSFVCLDAPGQVGQQKLVSDG